MFDSQQPGFDPYTFDPQQPGFKSGSSDVRQYGSPSHNEIKNTQNSVTRNQCKTQHHSEKIFQGVKRSLSFSTDDIVPKASPIHKLPRGFDIEAQENKQEEPTDSPNHSSWETFSVGWETWFQGGGDAQTRNEYMAWSPRELRTRIQGCPSWNEAGHKDPADSTRGRKHGQQFENTEEQIEVTPASNKSNSSSIQILGEETRSRVEDEMQRNQSRSNLLKKDKEVMKGQSEGTERQVQTSVEKNSEESQNTAKEKNVVTIRDMDEVSTLAGDTIDKLIDKAKASREAKSTEHHTEEALVVMVKPMCDISVLSITTRNLKAAGGSKQLDTPSHTQSKKMDESSLKPRSVLELAKGELHHIGKQGEKQKPDRVVSKEERQAKITMYLVVAIFVALIVAICSLAFGFVQFRAN